MTLTHWKPFDELMSLPGRFHSFFDDDFFKTPEKRSEAGQINWYPAADIYENKDEYVLKLEVAGINKEDIEVELCDSTLFVKGERKEETEVKKENFHRVERFTGKFSRSFRLPRDVDGSKINAKLENGILELQIPKAEEKKARAISINAN